MLRTCPRCLAEVPPHHSPDEKACSDNCITRHQSTITELRARLALAERAREELQERIAVAEHKVVALAEPLQEAHARACAEFFNGAELERGLLRKIDKLKAQIVLLNERIGQKDHDLRVYERAFDSHVKIAEAAEAQLAASRLAQQEAEQQLSKLQERMDYRAGRLVSLMEHICDAPLDPLPWLADEIKTLRAMRDQSQPDADPRSGASQRHFWLDHAVHVCESVERQVARLNIEAEEMRAQLAALRTALTAFLEKHDAVQPAVIGAFQMAAIHGMPYNGPNYAEELKALREVAALSAIPTEAQK